MKRRTLLAGAGILPAVGASLPTTSHLPPRKVVIGTVMQPFWEKHPGVDARLAQLAAIVDRMSHEARDKYGRGIDLAVLPEAAISGEVGGEAMARAFPFEGAVAKVFTAKARELGCYIVVPSFFREAARCSNAAVLLGRKGEVVGTYRKVHLVVAADGKTMEGGTTPGSEFPVWDCDFGKLGIQICFDMEFDRGWRELARKGAELIAWPTQSPQTAQPAARAMEQRCYIVSSTWRHNASVFEPTGHIIAQVKPPGQVLVQEIDLSYAILPWSGKLRNGRAMKDAYGDRAGYRYYEDEDLGMFWSNDPKVPVKQMVTALGLVETDAELARVREAYRKARVMDY